MEPDRAQVATFAASDHPGSELGAAGNEKGFLVEMSTCLDKDVDGRSLKLAPGDVVRLDSWYWVGSEDPRLDPLPAGTHLNVMGYMYAAFTSPDLPPSMAEATAAHRNMSFSEVVA